MDGTFDAELFWERVDKSGDCWLWTGPPASNGYGQVNVGRGKVMSAHKVAYILQYGAVPGGKVVKHSCDNKICVRHVEVGTYGENNQEAYDRGLKTGTLKTRGASNGNAKLTEKDVLSIRDMLHAGMTQQFIANQYQIGRSTVSGIATGRLWGHL